MTKIELREPRFLTRRATLQLIGTAAAAVALGGCAPIASGPSGTTQPAVAKPPKPGGTLRVGIVSGLTGTIEGQWFQANNADFYFTIWDRLIEREFGEAGTLRPVLAESWDISSDFKQHKFNLRKGVQFHSGRELAGDDVKYSVTRVLDPTIGSGHFSTFASWFAGSSGSIETPDKYTVVLKSGVPRPSVTDWLARLAIVDRDIYKDSPKANTKAGGTGPFRLAEYVPGDHVTLAKYPNYWQSGRPYLDGLTTKFFNDLQAMAVALEAGTVDYLMNPATRDIVRLTKDAKFKATSNPLSGWWIVMGMNTTASPTDNKLVRQALSYAVNRERWIAQELGGLGTPRSLGWAPSSLAYDKSRENFYKFDLDKAKSLLQRAGVTNLTLDFPYDNGRFPETASLSQIVQSDLATIGVKSTLRPLDVNGFRTDVLTRATAKYNLTFTGLGNASIREALVQYLQSAFLKPEGNALGFTSARYAQLIDSLSQEPDEAKRKALYGQLNDVLLDEAFSIAVASKDQGHLMRTNVNGVRYTMRDAVTFTDVWIDQ